MILDRFGGDREEREPSRAGPTAEKALIIFVSQNIRYNSPNTCYSDLIFPMFQKNNAIVNIATNHLKLFCINKTINHR